MQMVVVVACCGRFSLVVNRSLQLIQKEREKEKGTHTLVVAVTLDGFSSLATLYGPRRHFIWRFFSSFERVVGVAASQSVSQSASRPVGRPGLLVRAPGRAQKCSRVAIVLVHLCHGCCCCFCCRFCCRGGPAAHHHYHRRRCHNNNNNNNNNNHHHQLCHAPPAHERVRRRSLALHHIGRWPANVATNQLPTRCPLFTFVSDNLTFSQQQQRNNNNNSNRSPLRIRASEQRRPAGPRAPLAAGPRAQLPARFVLFGRP